MSKHIVRYYNISRGDFEKFEPLMSFLIALHRLAQHHHIVN